MKIIQNWIFQKLKTRDPFDILYIVGIICFLLILSFEFIGFLISLYTFQRASIGFLLLTLFYVVRKLKKSGFFDEEGVIEGNHQKKLKKYIRKIGYTVNIIFYTSFVLYALLVVFSFFTPIAFTILNTALLFLILVYIVWKICGGSFDIDFIHQPLTEKTFFKLLTLSSGLCFILLSLITKDFPKESVTLFILSFLSLHIIGFSFLFSSIFQNIYTFFSSGDFYTWIKNHIQISLSFILLCVSFLLILGKVGIFDFLFIKKIENIAEFVPQVREIQIETPEILKEKQLVSQTYALSSPLSSGDTGEKVQVLQQVLQKLGTYEQEITSTFDEYTRVSLRTALIEGCAWPETTKGIFGPQAKVCLDSLEIEK